MSACIQLGTTGFPPYGMRHCVEWYIGTSVSEALFASIFRAVQEYQGAWEM